MSDRGSFSGKIGFILATAGSAVGLGNIWRFPTEAASHGGGTFLLVYLIIVAVFGITMMLTEISLGRRSKASPVTAYEELGHHGKIIGILGVIVPIIILPYYCVIGGWLLCYLAGYVGCVDMAAPGLFGDFAGSTYALLGFAVFGVLVIGVIYGGVEKGIENISKIFMPLFFVLLVVLTIYVVLQPGMTDGIIYYLEPHMDQVDANTLLSALGQAFFSLSIAMGILITYGSYMRKDDDLEKNTAYILIIDTAVAFIAGLLIIPMAFKFGGTDMTGGAGLVFNVLPQIFDEMPGGIFVAVFFFVMISFAALTSAISIAEAVASTVIDRFHVTRDRAVGLILAPTLIVGALVCLGFGPLDFIQIAGKNLLDLFDYVSNSILMPIVAFLTCVFIGHVVGTKVISDEIESSGPFRIKRIYGLMIRWVCPILVAAIFVSSLGLF